MAKTKRSRRSISREAASATRCAGQLGRQLLDDQSTGGTILTANATIGVTQSGGNLRLNNAIGGNFALTKTGLGNAKFLPGLINTFSGGLAVQQGTLTTNNRD